MSQLAIHGGRPVRSPERPWPTWPRYTEAAQREVEGALRSGRWAISGPFTGEPSRNQRFAESFAAFHGVEHCVPTTNGSSALLVAIEAVGVDAEDEVIVPGLTWVANASAVVRANAVPILVDADPETLCVSPAAVRSALSQRTRAITAVHLYGSMADMDALRAIADEAGVALIEDCAHVHGARWRDAAAGSIGDIGVFSMQQTKLMTAGEGGAAITRRADLARRLEQLRADGRALGRTPRRGELELEELGEVLGVNHSLSEAQAALLLEALSRLEDENRLRARNAARLDAELSQLPGLSPVPSLPAQTRRAFYAYALRVDPARLGGRPVEDLATRLSAELHFPVERVYRPLNDNPIYRPAAAPGTGFSPGYQRAIDPKRFALPECERAHRECIAFHHRLLLGDEQDMDDVAAAFHKVWDAGDS
ncbi:MAG: aminotransferase class I/II-fold pyridoxal phosphate-dependent enzyme [Myxococcota bacterium]|nr:aminotransferase class I/II-fold pyridoxal phosphate-dependent enzyme [Myxococcota bacterium]